MRFVFEIGLWYGPNDIEHHKFDIVLDDIDDPEQALWFIVDWQMDVGRKLNADKPKPDAYPSFWRRPKNITSWKLLEEPC